MTFYPKNINHVTWSCHASSDQHEVGCPHRQWLKKQLWEALIENKILNGKAIKKIDDLILTIPHEIH